MSNPINDIFYEKAYETAEDAGLPNLTREDLDFILAYYDRAKEQVQL